MNYQDIQFLMEDGIGFITLNRPEKRNALSLNLMAEMIDSPAGGSKERRSSGPDHPGRGAGFFLGSRSFRNAGGKRRFVPRRF